MKIKISDNGGESWDLLLDVADLEYTDEELEISDFRRFRIDISDYAGKTVLIAFQYEGVYGDSMQLDEVYVRPMLPTAIYNRPQGTFLSVSTTSGKPSRQPRFLHPHSKISCGTTTPTKPCRINGIATAKTTTPRPTRPTIHRHTLGALSHRYVRFAPKFLHLERHSNGRPGHDHRQSRCQ